MWFIFERSCSDFRSLRAILFALNFFTCKITHVTQQSKNDDFWKEKIQKEFFIYREKYQLLLVSLKSFHYFETVVIYEANLATWSISELKYYKVNGPKLPKLLSLEILWNSWISGWNYWFWITVPVLTSEYQTSSFHRWKN